MSKGNTFENDLLALIFNGTAIANIADNADSGPLANLYVSLHTDDVGEAGNQETNEATYTSYARVAVSRNGSGWTVSANSAVNTAAIVFPEATGGSNTISHFAVGTASSGEGKVLYYGELDSSLAVSNGIEPRFAPGDLEVTED